MDDFTSISVVREGDHEVEIICNPTSYPLIGKGKQGAVFQISDVKCVKIYAKHEHALSESEVLQAAQESGIVPRLYEVGKNYVVMEYIDAQSLKQCLEEEGTLTENMVRGIWSLLQEMKRLKFTRLDARLDQILVTKEKKLKVIDHVYSFSSLKQTSRPERLLKGLKKLGMLSSFLEQVKILDPESYLEWKDDVT